MVLLSKIYDNDSVDKIFIYFFYANSEDEIYDVKKREEFIEDGKISRERQLYLIKSNQFNLHKQHKLISISYTNLDISSEQIENFANNNLENDFFKKLDILEDIRFNPSLYLFTKMNCIYYIFKQISLKNNTTKKIIFNTNHSKSRKKPVK